MTVAQPYSSGGLKYTPAVTRLANNQVTCQDLLAYLLTLASKQASHEASFFPSKQVVEALLACLLVGLVGWRFRRRIAGSMAKIANNKVHRYVACYNSTYCRYV